jgi:hypothetical protein
MPEQPAFGNRDGVSGEERADGVVVRRLVEDAFMVQVRHDAGQAPVG